MDSDAERYMDMNIVPKDQDQTRNVLWMMIFRIFMGKTCIFSRVRKHFFVTFLPVFHSEGFSFSNLSLKLFLSRIEMGEWTGYCEWIKLGQAWWGLRLLSGRGVTIRT